MLRMLVSPNSPPIPPHFPRFPVPPHTQDPPSRSYGPRIGSGAPCVSVLRGMDTKKPQRARLGLVGAYCRAARQGKSVTTARTYVWGKLPAVTPHVCLDRDALARGKRRRLFLAAFSAQRMAANADLKARRLAVCIGEAGEKVWVETISFMVIGFAPIVARRASPPSLSLSLARCSILRSAAGWAVSRWA